MVNAANSFKESSMSNKAATREISSERSGLSSGPLKREQDQDLSPLSGRHKRLR